MRIMAGEMGISGLTGKGPFLYAAAVGNRAYAKRCFSVRSLRESVENEGKWEERTSEAIWGQTILYTAAVCREEVRRAWESVGGRAPVCR